MGREFGTYGYVPEELTEEEERMLSQPILRGPALKSPGEGEELETYYVSQSTGRAEDGTPILPECLLPDNQGYTGLCWIFATNKALEFVLRSSNPNRNRSLPSVLRHSTPIIKESLVHIHHVIHAVEEVLHVLGVLLCKGFGGCVIDDAVFAQ